MCFAANCVSSQHRMEQSDTCQHESLLQYDAESLSANVVQARLFVSHAFNATVRCAWTAALLHIVHRQVQHL